MGADPAKLLGLLGLARRAGELHLGSGAVLRALEHETPGIVFLARDAGRDLRSRIERARGESQVEPGVFDAQALADAFQRQKLAVVSVHEPHFVAGIRETLAS